VIGNPPYIGFHGMEKDKPYLRASYASCSGKFDIYVAFIERGVPLLKSRQCLCIICPSTFMKRDFAKQFRQVLKARWKVVSLVDFGSRQIFADATNYTCIPVIANEAMAHDYGFLFAYGDLDKDPLELPSTLLDEEGWILADPTMLKALNKLLDRCQSDNLGIVVATISEGIVTGCNDVFAINEETITNFALEPTFVRKRLAGEHVHRFVCTWDNDYIIYPYRDVNGQTRVVPERELAAQSPNLWGYLRDKRARLAGRGYFERSAKDWYELWNQRNVALQAVAKIVVAEVEFRNKFSAAGADYY
jgi:adenine-specific DNA-methyltransferase